MTSYASLLAAGAALPPTTPNATGVWGSGRTATRTLGDRLGDWISAKDFGAVGDGTTDNTTALRAMRNYCRLDRSKLYHIYFPAGHYAYEENDWLSAIGSVRIEAYGAKFECYRDIGSHGLSRVINTGTMWINNRNYAPGQSSSLHVGSLIDNVARLAATVTLKATPVPSVFAAGRRVFVYGFPNQDNAFPPNARHFQYNTITSINTETGVITLEDPLNIELSDAWPDLGDNLPAGAARIMSMERPVVMDTDDQGFIQNPYTEILGAEFLNNRIQGAPGNGLTLDGDVVIFRDIIHHHSDTPTNNRVRWAYNSTFLNGTEGDKNVTHCRYEDCTIYNRFTQFTGIDHVEVINCHIKNEKIQASPRKLTVRGTTIEVPASHASGGVGLSSAQWSTERLIFEDNTIIHDGALSYGINTDEVKSFTATAVSEGIRIPAASFNAHILKIFPGTVLWTADMAISGKVSKIDYNPTDSEWVLIGDWPTIGTGNRNWEYLQYQSISEHNTKIIGGARPVLRNPLAAQQAGDTIEFEETYGGGTPSTFDYAIHGYVDHITVRIKRPYSGATANARFVVDVEYVNNLNTFVRLGQVTPITVPIKVEITETGATANVAITDTAAINAMVPVARMRLYLRDAGSGAIAGTGGQLPLISTRLKVSPIRRP